MRASLHRPPRNNFKGSSKNLPAHHVHVSRLLPTSNTETLPETKGETFKKLCTIGTLKALQIPLLAPLLGEGGKEATAAFVGTRLFLSPGKCQVSHYHHDFALK